MDSSGLNDISVVVVGETFVPTIKIDTIHNKIYWTEYNNDRIRRCNLDGTDLETVISNINEPSGLELDPNKERVYWSEYSNAIIKSAEFDGTSKKTETSSEFSGVSFSRILKFSIQEDKLYFLSGNSSDIYYLSSSKLYKSRIVPRPYYEVRFDVNE